MNATDVVILLVPAALIIWLLYDIWVATYGRRRYGLPTITSRIREVMKWRTVIPFGAGLVIGWLVGHLFDF